MRYLHIATTVLVFIILAWLPVVPVSIAPVVPNPTYSLRIKPFLQILWFAITRPDGVSYHWNWWTFVVIFVLLAVGCLASVLMFRKFGDVAKN